MILSEEHKQIFIGYLEQNIESSKLLLEGIEKMNIPDAVKGVLSNRHKIEIACFFFVMSYLKNSETVSINANQQSP